MTYSFTKCEDNPAEQYKEYLTTPAAEASLHGFFAVYPLRSPNGAHTTGKIPCGINGDAGKGVYQFTHTAAEVMEVISSPSEQERVIASIRKHLVSTAAAKARKAMGMPDVVADYGDRDISDDEFCQIIASDPRLTAAAEWKHIEAANITLLLGRRFDASIDGIIALDCDGHHPSEDFDTEALYREVSASGTGDHILYRVPAGTIPTGNGNKIKSTIAGREYELFYGQGNGIAISGMQAIANPNAPVLDMGSPAGRIITQLIHSGGGGGGPATSPTTRTTAGKEPQAAPPEPEQEEPPRLTQFEKYIIGIFEKSEKWKIETDMTPEKIKTKLKNPNEAQKSKRRIGGLFAGL